MQNWSTCGTGKKSIEKLNAKIKEKHIELLGIEKPNSTMIWLDKLIGSIKILHWNFSGANAY